MAEEDRVEALAAELEDELGVGVLHEALAHDAELVRKDGCVEALAPDLAVDRLHEALGDLVGGEAAVRVDHALEDGGVDHAPDGLLEGVAEGGQVALAPEREACGHGVAAEAEDGAGQGLRDEVERVAQVYARDRAARTLQCAVVRGREDDRRTVDLFLEAGGDEAHDALVEAAVVERERRKAVDVAARERGLGRLLHLRLELLTGGVEVVEAACIVERDDGIIGKEALDAVFHRVETTRRVDAGPERKAEVAHARGLGLLARDGEERADACVRAAGA